MPTTLPRPQAPITQADLRSAVYALVHAALAVSAIVLVASLHSKPLLGCFLVFSCLAVFNASMIGKHRQ